MENAPRTGLESIDTDKESGSEKKKKDTRKIGAFVKMSAEGSTTPVDRTEARKNFFESENQDGEKKSLFEAIVEKDTEKQEVEGDEETKSETENTAETVLRNSLLVEHLEEKRTQRAEELAAATPGTAEYIQLQEAQELDDKVAARAKGLEVVDNPVVDAEYQRQLAEIELPDETLETEEDEVTETLKAADEPAEEVAETAEASEPETDDHTTTTPSQPSSTVSSSSSIVTSSPLRPNPKAQASPAPVAPAIPTAAANNPPTPSRTSYGARNAGGNLPPLPPVNPNAAPAQNQPNVLAQRPERDDEQHRRRGTVAGGALLGYMVGRRGGRKRTERRLEPKIKELQKELEVTKSHLATREEEVKTAAAQQMEAAYKEKHTKKAELPAKPKPVSEILKQTVMVPEQLHTALPHIETVPITTSHEQPEKPKTKVEPRVEPKTEAAIKRAEQLSTPALLRAAENLFIEGTSVRRLYETNQIDRTGLVTIVQEGLSSGDLRKAFEKVELGPERQAERAREFRHDDPSFMGAADDNAAVTPTTPMQPKNNPLPNTPDKNSLQPLNVPAEPREIATPESIHEPNQEQKTTRLPKSAEFTFAAIAAIAITALIIWAIFS